ncbi:hypothetical protein UM91_13325 [Pseudomonas oryzihabitans]|uniref:hypothetical protein n=1 Tax=Pseudomonas oryzihabitans TaxID=47885 RepID=UPI0005CB3A29|nr:hypothetical protein [Pseudomonas oryzihabitans]KIZ50091.1 hypothetical protein UM91_13325 [Pseudomonas oryzihabitans]
MKKYIIKRVTHRVDGISQTTCIDPDSGRVSSLCFRTDAFSIPILPGRMYTLKTAKRSQGINLVAAVESELDISAWDVLVENNFFLSELQFKSATKRSLLARSPAQRALHLKSLAQNTMVDWEYLLANNQRILLGVAFEQAQQYYEHTKQLMAWGLSQAEAEACYKTYGSEACTFPLGWLKSILSFGSQKLIQSARALNANVDNQYHNALDFLTWLKCQSQNGQTIFCTADLPNNFRQAAKLCTTIGWVISDRGYCQLRSHAMLQVGVRRQLERISKTFFPTYTDQEARFSYSRYSEVIASYDQQHYEDEILTTINSRISLIRAESLPDVVDFTSQLSGTLQILYASPIQITVYSKSMLSLYETCSESMPVTFYDIPADLPDYTSVVLADCHLMTLSDFFLTLQKIPSTARLMLIDARFGMLKNSDHFLDTFNNHFPIIKLQAGKRSVSRAPSLNASPIDKTSPFNISMTNYWRSLNKAIVFVSDSPSIIKSINDSLRGVRRPIILENNDESFRKNDLIRISSATAEKLDSMVCRILSVCVKGLLVESDGLYSILSPQIIREANISLGFAMYPQEAIQAGVKSVVLVTGKSSGQAWNDYLDKYRIDVKQVYIYDHADVEPPTRILYQQLIPLVE